MPIISIILPIYNGEKTIRDTLKSVLEQTWTDFELVIVDDGSTDATLAAIAEFKDPRIQVYSYPNAGQATSRNRGISHATGAYIAFIDADDLWTQDKLEMQFAALQNHPEAAVAYSWTDYISESGEFLHPGRHTTANGDVYAELIVSNFLENGSNPLVRADALAHIGGFEASLPPAEDWDLWLRLAQQYAFVCVPAAQILYRVTVNSSSSNILKQERQCLKVLERAYDRVNLNELKPKSLANLYKYLMWKAIEGYPSRQNGMAAARCFWKYLHYHPNVLLNARFMLSVLCKIAAAIALPPKQAQMTIQALKSLKERKESR
jgi:glycosyltransferase involved in cell wall biosynthesis